MNLRCGVKFDAGEQGGVSARINSLTELDTLLRVSPDSLRCQGAFPKTLLEAVDCVLSSAIDGPTFTPRVCLAPSITAVVWDTFSLNSRRLGDSLCVVPLSMASRPCFVLRYSFRAVPWLGPALILAARCSALPVFLKSVSSDVLT